MQAVAYYAKRSYKYGRPLNILAQEHYQRAIRLAHERDQQLRKARENGTIESLGSLFGIPISIKDHICEAGESVTVGSTWMAANFKADKDASIV